MKKLLACLVAMLALATGARAAEGGIAWDKFPPERLNDVAALQNGAKLFVNYCLNCHSASYMRYNRLRDIGLSEEQIRGNLMFGTDKVGEVMKTAMDPKQAKEWFGTVPPDLTLVARSRAAQGKGTGADYLYTFLRSFYRDDTKATGWDNLAFPSVAMPHALWELQGTRRPVFQTVKQHGHDVQVFTGRWEQIKPGAVSQADYDNTVADLVVFMQWMGEPAQDQRVRLGAWVLIFLSIFTVIAWRLNAAYWKDIK
jgi:ubiquinol-cytochrome c reductase cytochrome c1 subunit